MVFMKKVLVSFIIFILILGSGFLGYLLVTTPKPKTFEGKGVTVELLSDFKVFESEKWQFYAENKDIAFMSERVGKLSTITDKNGNKLSFSTFTLETYLNFILATNQLFTEDGENSSYDVDIYEAEIYSESPLKGQMYYCYYKDYEGNFAYMLVVRESENFFYTINIACDADQLNAYRTKMLQYAMSIDVE